MVRIIGWAVIRSTRKCVYVIFSTSTYLHPGKSSASSTIHSAQRGQQTAKVARVIQNDANKAACPEI
jgi:hypothetical protein